MARQFSADDLEAMRMLTDRRIGSSLANTAFYAALHVPGVIFFSLAFAMLAGSWAWIATADPEAETRHYAYVLRLLAFVLIIGCVNLANLMIVRSASRSREITTAPAVASSASPAGSGTVTIQP